MDRVNCFKKKKSLIFSFRSLWALEGILALSLLNFQPCPPTYHPRTQWGLHPRSGGEKWLNANRLIIPFHYSWRLMEVWIASTGRHLAGKMGLRVGWVFCLTLFFVSCPFSCSLSLCFSFSVLLTQGFSRVSMSKSSQVAVWVMGHWECLV